MESPYMATIGSETEQVSADPTNTVEYGGATFVKLTASTYDVETADGEKLVINPENIICKLVDGVPETTNYEVIDPEPSIDEDCEFDQSVTDIGSYNPDFNTYWTFDPAPFGIESNTAYATLPLIGSYSMNYQLGVITGEPYDTIEIDGKTYDGNLLMLPQIYTVGETSIPAGQPTYNGKLVYTSDTIISGQHALLLYTIEDGVVEPILDINNEPISLGDWS